MALGVDQDFAYVCIEMGIPFLAAVPFIGQELNWPNESQKFYKEILEKAFKIEVISKGGYAAYKMQVRNKWMVDNCTSLIAVWDGSDGGTGNCVKYAKSINREIMYIDPKKADL